MSFFLQNVVNALQWGSFYALIALGYSMVYGVLLLFNFAHGDIFMLGAFIAYYLISKLNLPLYLVFVLTMLCTAAASSLRPRTWPCRPCGGRCGLPL